MDEVWKEIPGTNGRYLVSNFGRVRSLPRVVSFGKRNREIKEKILKQVEHGDGYYQVMIDKKHKYVHRLVASAFLDNPYNLPQINHKDENKGNNCVDNLEWCDGKYNVNYGSCPERSRAARMAKKNVINLETGIIYECPLEAQKETGIHHDSISRACRGRKWTAGGFHWKYVNG